MAFCVKCGTTLPEESLFCPKCGTDLRTYAQQLPEQPVTSVEQPVVPAQPYQMPVSQPPVMEAVSEAKTEPGAGQVKAGRIFSVIGFAFSVFILAASVIFMALAMSMENIRAYGKLVFNMAAVALESIGLSSFGLFFSRRGEKKGASKAAVGKRFGWIGLVLSLIALANVILILIAFFFSGRILST